MQLSGECFREQKGRSTQRLVINQEAYFIKQHRGVGWKEIFKNLIQLKLPVLSAKKEWLALQKLQALSILTPRVRAYACRGWNPARLQSYLVMEEIKPSISLEDFCRHWKTEPPPFSLKLALIRKLAHIAKIMHENGIHHRDFYLCHFLLDPQSLSTKQTTSLQETLKLYLIDLHRAGRHHSLTSRWVVKDLAGLYFSSREQGLSKRDYWRFIKCYRQQALRDIIMKEKKFWRQVTRRGEKLYHAHALR
ncbi:MAG TPA: lipopolysaccharide core heptose(I) kinase RfaP [Gammaproteobacteria bacterium]|nr:lipopolysaccharide core heptose(I) kinase RfaP [Gammaproteobacteria bacterium]